MKILALDIGDRWTGMAISDPLGILESDQTKKVLELTETLKNLFPAIEWKMWDERLTSKQAATIKSTRTKEDKLRSHAIAAAIFLGSYLEYKRFHENPSEE